jgi:phosphoribosylaminoimidazole carboxylase (NCAIR synthetase)
MVAVAFVAPYLLETTSRFVKAAARLPGVQLGVITAEPAERVRQRLGQHVAAHWRVDDPLDPGQLAAAVRGLSAQLGDVERIIGVLEQLQVPLAQVRGHLGLAGVDLETAVRFREKAHMKDVLRAAGVPCARHRLVGSPDAARSFVEEVGFPVVVKPPAGAGAKSTFRLDDADDLRVWLDGAPPVPEQPALIEEFLTGDEGSFDSVMVDTRLVWHSISHYLPTPLEVLRNPWIQWAVLLPRDISGPDYSTLRGTAAAALGALGLDTGLTHMEWFRRPDGSIAVSEVAVRPPGAAISEMLNYAYDMDLYGAWARLMVYDEFDPPERRWAVGAVYPRGQGSGRVRAVHGLDRLQAELGSLVVEAQLPQPGQVSSSSYEGDGHVVVRHQETSTVLAALRRLVAGIRVELE